MEQQQNTGRIESFMTELGRKLDQLMDRARQGAEEARFSEKMEELKQTKEKLEQELHEFVQDDERWREVQAHLQGAAQELKKAVETSFKSKKSNQEASGGQGNTTNAPDTDQQQNS